MYKLYRLLDCISVNEVENGMIGYIDNPIDSYETVYNFVIGTPTNNETIAVVCNPVGYNSHIQSGIPFRVFIPMPYSELTIISGDEIKILQFSKDLKPRWFTIDN